MWSVPGQPRPDGAVGQHLDVGQRAGDARSRASPGGGCGSAARSGRRACRAAAVAPGPPRRSASRQNEPPNSIVPPSTRTTPWRWHRGAGRPAPAPRWPPQLWPATQGRRSPCHPRSAEHGQQVIGEGGEVVAAVGLVGPAVAPLVDGGDRMAGARPARRPPRPTVGRWTPARARAAPGVRRARRGRSGDGRRRR